MEHGVPMSTAGESPLERECRSVFGTGAGISDAPQSSNNVGYSFSRHQPRKMVRRSNAFFATAEGTSGDFNMADRVHYHPGLVFSPGSQVVTNRPVVGEGGRVLHPRGAVGVDRQGADRPRTRLSRPLCRRCRDSAQAQRESYCWPNTRKARSAIVLLPPHAAICLNGSSIAA